MLNEKQRAFALPLLRDMVGGAGAACALAGVWQIYHPAALILGGAGMVGAAWLWARAS